MATEKMTIHRGLAELKLTDSKIEKQIQELLPVGVYQKGKKINNIATEEEYKTVSSARYQSIESLMDRKIKLKSAIVKANSITMVKIAGKDMTIAEAINFKGVIILRKKLLDKLTQSRTLYVGEMNKQNAVVDTNLQNILLSMYGKDQTKVSPEDLDNVRKPFIESNTWHLFDPLKIDALIEKITKEIGDFEVECDATLSEINAVTTIEF